MMKKCLFTGVIILLVLSLCGCSALSFSDADIMCPPRASGDKAEIQELIDSTANADYVLKYPNNGSNKSAIIMHDLDADNVDEAIAFYSVDSDNKIHMLLADDKDGEWTATGNIAFESDAIDRVSFADIDSDGTAEIIMGVSLSGLSLCQLYAYKYKDKLISLDTTSTYSSFVTGDFNSDSNEDVLLLTLNSGDNTPQAKLLVNNNDGGLSEISSVELDPDIESFASVLYGRLDSSSYGTVIDGVNSSGEYLTQVIFFDNSDNRLKNPLFTYAGYDSTKRSTQLCSKDMDNDEVIEIPLCSQMSSSSDEDTNTVSRLASWSYFDSATVSLVFESSAILCPSDGYMFTMPGEWENVVTARYDKKSRELTVYAWEYVSSVMKKTDKLLTIKTFNKSDYDEKMSGFAKILETDSSVYAYSVESSDNSLAITGDDVLSALSLV